MSAEIRPYYIDPSEFKRSDLGFDRSFGSAPVAQEAEMDRIQTVLSFFDAKEQGGKPIPGREVLAQRLVDLSQGMKVPVVIFNCIDFAYSPTPDGDYPFAYPKIKDAKPPIAGFFKPDIDDVVTQLQTLGQPDVRIIIPNSEFDNRVMNLPQSEEDLVNILEETRQRLLPKFADSGYTVSLLTEFCAEYGLRSPFDYTEANYLKLKELVKLKPKYVKSSQDYFKKLDVRAEYVDAIPTDVMRSRLEWYYGMYAGEGQALQDSGAIVLNLEDNSRVSAWIQRGASNFQENTQSLPVVTPVVTKAYRADTDEENDK